MKVLLIGLMAFSFGVFARESSTSTIHLYGSTMVEVEQKVAVEIQKMRAGNYRNRLTGRTCDEAKPYKVGYNGAGSSYSVEADGSLHASRPMGWISYKCTNYSDRD